MVWLWQPIVETEVLDEESKDIASSETVDDTEETSIPGFQLLTLTTAIGAALVVMQRENNIAQKRP